MGADSRAPADASCEEAVCSKREDLFDAVRAAAGGRASTSASSSTARGTTNGSCPLDVDELGRASWALVRRDARRARSFD
jgi:hypothetical protein